MGGQAAGAGARVQPRGGVHVPPEPSGEGRPGPAFHVHPRAVPPPDLRGAGGLVDDRGRARPAGKPRQCRLRSTALDDEAADRPAYLAEDADVEAMVRGTRLARELAAASAFDPWRGAEALPGEAVQTRRRDRGLRPSRGRDATTTPSARAAWASGPDAVVDPSLRVRGLQGLRVADASVMPSIVSANTNTAAMIIGEHAAELVRAPSARARVRRAGRRGRVDQTSACAGRARPHRIDDELQRSLRGREPGMLRWPCGTPASQRVDTGLPAARAAVANASALGRKSSYSAVRIAMGGRPAGSPNAGTAYGVGAASAR